MRRAAWLAISCLLGGLMVAAVAAGLRAPVRAAEVKLSLVQALPHGSTAITRAVVINEVAWAGHAKYTEDEWIELYNTTATTISLEEWHLIDDDSMNIALGDDIPPYGYYLIERSDNSTVSDIAADWVSSFGTGGLSNSGEVLTLTDNLGRVIDTANADGNGWPAGTGSTGVITYATMERIDPAAPDADANWATNDGVTRNGLDADGAPINGTPKCRNSASSPAADLTVAFGGVPAQVDAGDRFTYTLRFRNAGNVTATAAWLTNTLPAGLTFFTQTGAFAFDHPHTSTLVWEIGDLAVSAALSAITVVVDVDADASGVLTSAVTATTSVTDTPAANNTASVSVAVREPPPLLADLAIAKAGPIIAAPGSVITYYITLSNTGFVTATAVRVTDTLPTAVDFVIQTSPFTCSPLNGVLAWEVGSVPTGTLHTITITAQVTDVASGTLTNWVTATTAASETTAVNNTAAWTTTVLPRVHLYALAPANYWGSGEAAALINLSPYSVSLDGWRLNDAPGSGGVSFLSTATIAAGQILWLAQNADGFYPVWGFDADGAAEAVTRPVSLLTGTWPLYFFTDEGEAVYLLDAGGNVVDALAYGTGSATAGWSGPAAPYPYSGYGKGQVIYRKLDQATGLPVADTDTAADWAQDADDPINGRKLRYPGWDLEDLFFPAEITTTVHITLAVAPEGMLDVVSQTVASAQHSLRIQAYTLESVALYQVISDRIRAGVVVTALLESSPGEGIEDVEKWIVQRLHNPPTSTVYFIGGTASRYRYQHAKFILVDDRLALVSTDNFGENSMPSDLKDNGTSGHRGFVGVTDSPQVVAYLGELFRRDCDPLHHQDVVPYDGSFAAPDPLPPTDWTGYAPVFTVPLATTATHITVLHAPEQALRDRDALLGLLEQARDGDRIAVMQLNEPFTWTVGAGAAGLNPRLQVLVEAARNQAEVRILLDSYYDDPLAVNGNTAACLALNAIAAQEHLSLTCRLANVAGLGIHAKLFLADVGGEKWVHLGSINGTENSNKRNREVALQFRSEEAYEWTLAVFDHDWSRGHGPMIHRVLLPLVLRDYVSPADYPLVTEVFVNPAVPPEENEAMYEWIEIYNPGPAVDIAGWTLGDAINVGDYGDGRYSFPAGAQFLQGQVIVAAACATNSSAAYGRNPDYEWTDCDDGVDDLAALGSWEGFGLALGNAQDEAVLLRADGSLADSVAWGDGFRVGVTPFTSFTSTIPAGFALKRYPPDTDRDDCSRDFYVGYPSPGYVSGD